MERDFEIYAIDFDGTLCIDKYPNIGKAKNLVKQLIEYKQEHDVKYILWTCRCGEYLDKAVEWCKERGLYFDAINENLPEMIEMYGNDSRKIFADKYIDDKSAKGLSQKLAGREEKMYYPNDLKLNKTLNDFVEHRRKMKKPMSEHAVDLLMGKLERMSNGDNDKAIELLEEAMLNGWQGIYDTSAKKGNARYQKSGGIDWGKV